MSCAASERISESGYLNCWERKNTDTYPALFIGLSLDLVYLMKHSEIFGYCIYPTSLFGVTLIHFLRLSVTLCTFVIDWHLEIKNMR